MDGERFDNLTRAWARSISRRRLLQGLIGGSLGGASVLLGRQESGAFICRQPGVLCAKDAHCCSGACGADHHCVCPDAGTLCSRDCANLLTDPAHCGSCDTSCAKSDVCIKGVCCTPTTCSAQAVACGSIDDGCGGTLACGDCPYGSCQGGQCVCPDGTALCGGSCVSDCSSDRVLDQTSCTCVCPADNPFDCGNGRCAACCTDDQCGEGRICATGQECFNGSTCPAGEFCHYGADCQSTQCCMPQAHAPLCFGWCGFVIDNCGQRVDCGDCSACRSCQVDGSHNSCFEDESQNGNACDPNDADRTCCHGECAKATGTTCDRDFDCCSGNCRGGVCCAKVACGGECCDSGTCCIGLGPSSNHVCCAGNCCSISTTTGEATCC